MYYKDPIHTTEFRCDMSSYNVVVLGVGNVGKVIVRGLIDDPKVDKIYAVDYNFNSLKTFVDSLGSEKVIPLKGDIRDIDATAEQMKKGDFVINASWYEFNIHAIKAMLKAGRDMADLGGLYWMTRKELEWDDEVKKRGLSLLLGAGDDPGTSNVLARIGYDKMDEPREIHIRWGSAGGEEDLFGFSVVTIMDEATMNAVAYIDGKLVELPPLSGKELTYFPEPIGYQYTYSIIHSELATLPYTLDKVKTITYKDTWDESIFPIIDFLRKTGLTSREKINVLGAEVSPLHVLGTLIKPREDPSVYGALRVEVRGVKDGVDAKLTYFLGPVQGIKEWGAGVTAVTTAFGALAGLQCLVEGLVPKGVSPPETIEEPMTWIKYLASKGLYITEVTEKSSRLA